MMYMRSYLNVKSLVTSIFSEDIYLKSLMSGLSFNLGKPLAMSGFLAIKLNVNGGFLLGVVYPLCEYLLL